MTIETAGTIDLDVELKFNVDELRFSIDVRKKFLESLKDIYKALSEISRLQQRNAEARDNAVRTLDAVSTMYRINNAGADDAIVKQYTALLDNFNNTVLDRFGGTRLQPRVCQIHSRIGSMSNGLSMFISGATASLEELGIRGGCCTKHKYVCSVSNSINASKNPAA